MASKVKRGFLYYLVWILVIAVGIVCILGSIMIFNPGKDVLGINLKFVSDSQTYKVNQLEVGGSKKYLKQLPITTINFEGGYTDFKVTQNNDYEQITILIKKNISGFTSSNKLTHSVTIDYLSGELNIKATEPELSLGFSEVATVTICCPASYSFNNYDFNIKTTSGAINFSADAKQYTPTVKSLNIETQTGYIYLSKNINVNTGNVSIKSKTSNIDINADIKTLLKIDTDASKIKIDTITGDFSIKANELKAKCNKIGGNIHFSSLKGYIEIQELGDIATKTNGNFSEIIDSMHIANVIIKKMAGSLSLPNAKQSNISVDEIYGNAFIRTTNGTVNLIKAYGELDIITDSGNISATKMMANRTYIETNSGQIAINFANIGKTDLITNKSNIVVNLKENLNATINYSTAIYIYVSWINSNLEKIGTIQTPEYIEQSAVEFTAKTKTSGNIYIKNTYIEN